MPKPVIASRTRIVFLFGLYQSAENEFFPGKAAALCPLGECCPRIGRIANLPMLGRLDIQSALAEVTAGRLSGSRSQKVTMKPVGGLEM